MNANWASPEVQITTRKLHEVECILCNKCLLKTTIFFCKVTSWPWFYDTKFNRILPLLITKLLYTGKNQIKQKERPWVSTSLSSVYISSSLYKISRWHQTQKLIGFFLSWYQIYMWSVKSIEQKKNPLCPV
jgi:hypothetical protein